MRVTCLEVEVKAMRLVRPSGREESKGRIKGNVRESGKILTLWKWKGRRDVNQRSK